MEQQQQQLQAQIEFYFSEFNLGRDAYLLSLMDKDGYAPLQIVAQFKRVKLITLDMELIRQAVSHSNLVELNEDKNKIRKKIVEEVKPTIPTQRTTIVLRDIPNSQFKSEDIAKLFDSFSIKPKTVKPDILDTWFLDFETENETLEALEFIRTQSLVEGKPIQGRIKATAAASTDIPPPIPPMYPQRNRSNYQNNRQRNNGRLNSSPSSVGTEQQRSQRRKAHAPKQQELPQSNQFPALSKSSVTDNTYLVSGYSDQNVKKYSKEEMSTVFAATTVKDQDDCSVNKSSILYHAQGNNNLVHLEQKQKDVETQHQQQHSEQTSEVDNTNRIPTFAEIVITSRDQSNKVKSRSRSNSKPLTPRA